MEYISKTLVSITCASCNHLVEFTQDDAPKIFTHFDKDPANSLENILRKRINNLRCEKCGAHQAVVSRLCLECGSTIPDERIDIYPEVNLCVQCQELIESAKPVHQADIDHGTCPRCGKKLTQRLSKKTSPTSYFIGCSGYPKCRYTEE